MSSAYRTEHPGPKVVPLPKTFCVDCSHRYSTYENAEWKHWRCRAPTGKMNPVTGAPLNDDAFCEHKNTRANCQDFEALPVVVVESPKTNESTPPPAKRWWLLWLA